MIDDAIASIDRLCDELLAGQSGDAPAAPVAAALTEIRSRLAEPLRVAIGGRLKAGKSTLVNALVGERIAQTDVGECTRVVTWFRFGDTERIEVERAGGPAVEMPLTGRQLPATLGVPVEQVTRVTVWARIPALRDVTIIDTPGLETLTEGYAANTRAFLGIDEGSARATTQADALVYVMPHPRETDEITLEAFRTAFPSGTRTALNTVGLLSRIDTLSDDDDPWPATRRQAARASERLGALVATVVPVVGLLAETIGTGRLTEADAINVAKLAALDPTTRARALIGVDQLRGLDPCDVSPTDRERLIELLGLYGLRQAVALAGSGARSASDLSEGLREASGIDALREVLAATITARAGLFKSMPRRRASRASRWLTGTRSGPDASARVQAVVEQIRLDPDMHQLTEMDLLRELASGTLDVASDLVTELHTLLGPGTPGTRLGIGSLGLTGRGRRGGDQGGDALERGRERPAQQPRHAASRRVSPTSRRCTCGARHSRKPRGERVVGARRADGIVQAPGSALRPAHTTPARESGALDRWR